nr:SDR family oxidoreductase [uncultured Anaeromusa sp.]
MKGYYEGKAAVITGGASGIGLAIGELLLSLGAKAVVLADVNAAKLQAQSERLSQAYPGKVLGVETDVTSQDSVKELIAKAAAFGGGRLDLLFNNAGIGALKSFEQTTDEDWKLAFDVNFYGALYGIRAALPIMRAQGGGHIANTASGIVFSPMPEQTMYSATKSALMGLGGSLRYELWDDNIRVSTIIPGTVITGIWQGVKPPAEAITPAEAAAGILAGVARNEKIVIVTEQDQQGSKNVYDLERQEAIDTYMVNIARKRKKGIMNEY